MKTLDAPALSRRSFLQLSALAGGGLLLAFDWLEAAPGDATAVTGQFAPNGYLRITPNGKVTLFSKNPECGQGVKTALPMIVAEELGVDITAVTIEQAPTDEKTYGRQFAGGSRSVPDNYDLHRKAGAAARMLLVAAAARTWNVPEAECQAEKGAVVHAKSGRALAYGALVNAAAQLPVPAEKDIVLKSPKDFTLLGRRIGGVDNPAIVSGKGLFGSDFKLPGMLHASYQRCPVPGGKVKSANLDKIKALPGVKDAFVLEGGTDPTGLVSGVAILADSTWAAMSARKQLQVTWDEGSLDGYSTAAYEAKAAELGKQAGKEVRKDGDVEAAFKSAKKVVEAAYSYPFISHANLEPQNCTARVQDGKVGVWAPTQNPGPALDLLVKTLGVKKEDITLHVLRIGGGFGRRLINDFVAEAAAIAQKAKAPVKLTWTREDDMRHDFYRPGGFHFLRGAVDAAGKISAWRNHFVTFCLPGGTDPMRSAGLSPEELPARFLENYRLEQSMIPSITPSGPLRAPGSNAFAFVFQSFIDELAHAAGRDPLEVRLDLLGEDRKVAATRGPAYDTARMKGVVRRAAKMANWGRKLESGRGLGLAFHFSHSGYVAQVVEASVAKDGSVKVHDVWCAADVGPILNRSGAENQIEGSILDGLSEALTQEITIENGRTVQSNFHEYALIRMNEAPRVHIEFIESDNPPTGLGEPALPPTPPALCNAIFAACGKRIRTLPISKTNLAG
ncbi:MAG: xanthine dehydrogenase family protein molybdopterin-binding subunit [Verrucomicrobia bacterium]|nr:xanthine dehydrogenase family protein molybdopterin-binding subunit [Verrucomicrobiota bacterium]